MYKELKTFEDRCNEAKMMKMRYMDRVPVIMEPKCQKTPLIDKKKYMAPGDLTFGQLFYVVRKRLALKSEQALFFFLDNNLLLQASWSLFETYENYANDDGFLYIRYSLENTFGQGRPFCCLSASM